MELRQLRTFIAVVEYGGFRRAATRLHFSQPAVTAQINALERSIGVRLFERSPAGVRLTAAGRRFMVLAVRLVDLSREATDAARQEELSGYVRIGVFPSGAAELTRPLLTELRRLWPGVDLQVVTLPLTQWAPTIDGLDALITRDPVDRAQVHATELFAEPLLLAVPWTWPAREAEVLSTEQALSVPLVRPSLLVPDAVASFWCVASQRDGTEIDFRGYGADCPQDAADGVAHGFGAAFTTTSLMRSFGDNRFVAVPFEASPLARSWLTSRLDDHRSVITALHREVAAITSRLGALILPELAASTPLLVHDEVPGSAVGTDQDL